MVKIQRYFPLEDKWFPWDPEELEWEPEDRISGVPENYPSQVIYFKHLYMVEAYSLKLDQPSNLHEVLWLLCY